MPELPKEKAEKRSNLGLEVESELLTEVKRQAKMQGVTIRAVVEYGMRSWLEASRHVGKKAR